MVYVLIFFLFQQRVQTMAREQHFILIYTVLSLWPFLISIQERLKDVFFNIVHC